MDKNKHKNSNEDRTAWECKQRWRRTEERNKGREEERQKRRKEGRKKAKKEEIKTDRNEGRRDERKEKRRKKGVKEWGKKGSGVSHPHRTDGISYTPHWASPWSSVTLPLHPCCHCLGWHQWDPLSRSLSSAPSLLFPKRPWGLGWRALVHPLRCLCSDGVRTCTLPWCGGMFLRFQWGPKGVVRKRGSEEEG